MRIVGTGTPLPGPRNRALPRRYLSHWRPTALEMSDHLKWISDIHLTRLSPIPSSSSWLRRTLRPNVSSARQNWRLGRSALATVEVTLTGDHRILQECWKMIQKSTTLHSLHIAEGYGCSAPWSHPTVQRLPVVYPLIPTPTHVHSSGDVRIPRPRDVTIGAWGPKALMQLKLIDTPVLSLGLARQRVHGDPDGLIEELWVDAVALPCRSVPLHTPLG